MGKGKGKGKKGEAGGSQDGAEMSPIQVAQMLQAENIALQRQLAERKEEASKALAGKREIQAKFVQLKKDFEDEQQQTYSITADMTRQYKAMQEELLNRINILENTVTELKDQLELAKESMDEVNKRHEAVLHEKDAEINEQKRRMEEMAREFGDMLKETLDKMSERIEINGASWDNENAAAIHRQIAEYKMN